jgi:hypothetical protein
MRIVAAMLAATVVSGGIAAPGSARAAPFEEVPLDGDGHLSHRAAYVCLASGLGLIGASFEFSRRANREYDRYLESSDPAEIVRRFDRTGHYDRLSNGSLIAGEVLLATGLYLRFLRPRPGAKVTLSLDPGRCSVSWRF